MVDSRYMVEKGMLYKRDAVDDVHADIENGEGRKRCEQEYEAVSIEK